MSPHKLLLVDDDDTLRKSMAFILKKDGWRVDVASDAESALELFDPAVHGLVLTDLGMPGMGGMKLISALRERSRGVPIVVFSAFGDCRRIDEALDRGASVYLQKPMPYPELADALHNASHETSLAG